MTKLPNDSPKNLSPKPNRSLREKIHEIIFGAHTRSGLTFDLLLLIAIILSVIAISLETVGSIKNGWSQELFFIKWFFTILFTIEYLLRIISVKRPLKYIFSFWGIIDLLAILPDYILLLVGLGGIKTPMNSNAFSVVRSLRLLRVFRILNLSWFQHEAEDLGNAIWNARGKIIVFLMVVMIIVTVAGTIMYEVETAFAAVDEDGVSTCQFTSIPNGIYWAIVTMTTVGFGDIVPVTMGGKFISAMLILLGYSLIIVPTGFVSAEVIESRQSRGRKISTISCASCLTEDHDADAVYCKFCGERL